MLLLFVARCTHQDVCQGHQQPIGEATSGWRHNARTLRDDGNHGPGYVAQAWMTLLQATSTTVRRGSSMSLRPITTNTKVHGRIEARGLHPLPAKQRHLLPRTRGRQIYTITQVVSMRHTLKLSSSSIDSLSGLLLRANTDSSTASPLGRMLFNISYFSPGLHRFSLPRPTDTTA